MVDIGYFPQLIQQKAKMLLHTIAHRHTHTHTPTISLKRNGTW